MGVTAPAEIERGVRAGRRGRGLRGWRPSAITIVPAALLVLVAFALPVVVLLSKSVTEAPGGLASYEAVATSGFLLKIILRSLLVATVVSVLAVLLGYPCAYLAATARPRARALLLGCIGVSLFISLVVRGYSWLAILDRNGLLAQMLHGAGFEEVEVSLVHNFTGIVIGMLQYGVPLMVLPLYDVMRRIDPRLMRAAQSLGASPARAFARVYLPLSVPGVAAGTALVFVTTLGYYVLPSLLGGAQNVMIGQFIATSFTTTLDYGLGAATAVVLLLVAGGSFLLISRSSRRFGGADGGGKGA